MPSGNLEMKSVQLVQRNIYQNNLHKYKRKNISHADEQHFNSNCHCPVVYRTIKLRRNKVSRYGIIIRII